MEGVQALKGGQCACSMAGQGEKSKVTGSRQTGARVIGRWPSSDFRFQEECSRRMLKGPQWGMITGLCICCLLQITLQQESEPGAVQVESSDDDGLD